MKTFSMISLRLWMQDHLRLKKDHKKYREDPTKDLVLSDLVDTIQFHEKVLLDHCPAWEQTNLNEYLRANGYLPVDTPPSYLNQVVMVDPIDIQPEIEPVFDNDQLNDLSRTIITLAGVAIAIIALCSGLYIWKFYGL